MDIWLEKCSNKRLGTIGQTRWWAKDIALSKIFGHFNEQDSSLYIELITTLEEIYTDSNIKSDIRYKSKGLLESLCKYETILTAQTFLRIFKHTTHLSKNLQTLGLDLLQAHRMVTNTISSIKDISRDFSITKEAADKFVQRANIQLESLESNLIVEDSFPEVRQRKKKRLFSYESEDTQSNNLLYSYECNVYNSMIDTIINSLEIRFEKHGQHWADFSCLDPQNFKEISRQVPPNSLEKVFSIIKQFNNDITLQSLQQELQDFALKWETLSQSLTEEYYNTKYNNTGSSDIENNYDKEDYENSGLIDETILDDIPQKSSCYKSSDKKCHICCFFVLVRYNLYTNAYLGLYLAYKLLLTLSVSQVSCERTFSKLKHVKTSIRSTLSQQNLETLMLMSMEKDILMDLDNNDIINTISTKSDLLKKY